jgi:hypothetical protein
MWSLHDSISSILTVLAPTTFVMRKSRSAKATCALDAAAHHPPLFLPLRHGKLHRGRSRPH